MRYRMYFSPTTGDNVLGRLLFIWGLGLFLLLPGVIAVCREVSSNGGFMTLINNGTLFESIANGSSLASLIASCIFGLPVLNIAIKVTVALIKSKKQ